MTSNRDRITRKQESFHPLNDKARRFESPYGLKRPTLHHYLLQITR